MANALKNVFHSIKSYQYRRQLKKELIKLITQKHSALDRGLQFHGVTHDNPSPDSMTIMLVLQDIMRERRDLAIANWPGGISIVRRGQVEEIPEDMRKVNEEGNFLIVGGTDKGANLLDHAATPIGSGDYRPDMQLSEESRQQIEENRKKMEEERRRIDAAR
jgi:hypothetical protein